MKKTCPSSCLSEMSLALSSRASSSKVICDILLLNLRDCCWLYLYSTRLMAGVENWRKSRLLALGVGYWRLCDETSLPSSFHTIFFKNKIKSVLFKICVGNVLHTTNPKRDSSEKMEIKHNLCLVTKTQHMLFGARPEVCKQGKACCTRYA
jgi:hypothetical protein